MIELSYSVRLKQNISIFLNVFAILENILCEYLGEVELNMGVFKKLFVSYVTFDTLYKLI